MALSSVTPAYPATQLLQNGVRIDRFAFPPLAFRAKAKDGEVEMRGVGRGVSGAAHVANDVAAPHLLPLVQIRGVSVEMRVVVRERFGRIELVNRDPAAALA